MDEIRANVKIICENSSTTKILIDGQEVHGVQAYRIEQNSTDKRTPIYTHAGKHSSIYECITVCGIYQEQKRADDI